MASLDPWIAAVLIATTLPLASLADPAGVEEQQNAKPELMFVQTADDIKADDKTLRLMNLGRQTLYFADRPVRLAGHIPTSDYLKEWMAAAGPNNFAEDPPNATLSVYEVGKSENTLAVVEISDPVVDGNDLVYHYRLIEGPMPRSGGATALFIDWIGVGGGVGPGFHGIGAGTRGAGLHGGYGGIRR